MFQNGHANGLNLQSTTGGLGMLAQLHGAEKRVEQRLVKKLKTEHPNPDDDDKKDPSKQTSSRHGNQGMGTYFKLQPESASVSTTGPSSHIDLTGDDIDTDDDLQITGVKNLDEQEVCYGMVDGFVLAWKVPRPVDKNRATPVFNVNQWPVIKLALRRVRERGNTVECLDPHDVTFGNIDNELAEAVAPVMDEFKKLRVQARLVTRSKKPREEAHMPCSDKYRLVANIYGRKGDVHNIGRWFGQKNIFFRPPMVPDAGIEILNPHARKLANTQKNATFGGSAVLGTARTVEEATDAVSRLFDYQAEEGNEIPETEQPRSIVTPLLSHQKQALTFLLRQEQPRTFSDEESGNSSLWRKQHDRRGRIIYEEVVTGIQVNEEPPQCLGGLLADVMGLGKTIQALSLIASTADQAVTFGQTQMVRNGEAERDLMCNSRATLLVVPVSTVKNWEDQIVAHTKSGSMTFYVYHGTGRIRNPFKLADNDVVITTYSTAAHEMFSRAADPERPSPLKTVRWFRIILDEAHTIRESKSSQAKAMYSLSADRRWCLTGTPIQNRMEDLGSLTAFLRLYPYDNATRFNQYVRGPAQSGDPKFLKKLRVFVDSFTLRRLRDCINLPPRDEVVIDLDFTPEERKLHDFFRKKFSVAVKEVVKEARARGTGGQFHRVLQGITILRLICDHGKELLKPEQLEEYKGNAEDDPIDLDDDRPKHITWRDAYNHMSLLDGFAIQCALCGRLVNDDSPVGTPGADDTPIESLQAVVLPCYDIICSQCLDLHKATLETGGPSLICPNTDCLQTISPQYFPIPKTYAEDLEKDKTAGDTRPTSNPSKNGHYSGPHTKTRRLLQDIEDMNAKSVPLVAAGEPPLKCVVFSEFTSHLDLIGKALTDNGHNFVRIDGTMTLPARRRVLDALNNDPKTTILLASIKAAGQGLNLTAASHAIIMEPMWNPAAETQAVDRIYRIGQNREVFVKKYKMKDSMEDKIVELQKKKTELAKLSMEKKEMQKVLGRKERNEASMKAMLDIFKS